MERFARALARTRALSLKPLLAALVLPKTLAVCADCDFKSIAQAVAAADRGAVITVKAGNYKENDSILIDKPLTLQGEGGPVIDGEKKERHMVVIAADDVTIRGLTFKDSGVSYTQEISGIRVTKAKNCVIENNRFLDTTYAMYLEESQDCRIAGNELRASNPSESAAGNGIHLWNSSGHLIEKNTIMGHRDGIYFEFVYKSKIRDNVIRKNIRYGLHFMHSSDDDYFDNTFSENGAGVAVMYSKNVNMLRNKFLKNRGAATYGLLLKDITDSRMENNVLSDNTVAIHMEGTNRTKFLQNEFASNGWAVQIMGDCEGNEFTRNNFVSNTFDASTNSDFSLNDFHENYWSHYDGYDLNRDGIGDTPYRPVSVSSIILERADSTFILLNSFLFELLNEIERALPALIPERLKDEKPLMKKAKAQIP